MFFHLVDQLYAYLVNLLALDWLLLDYGLVLIFPKLWEGIDCLQVPFFFVDVLEVCCGQLFGRSKEERAFFHHDHTCRNPIGSYSLFLIEFMIDIL